MFHAVLARICTAIRCRHICTLVWQLCGRSNRDPSDHVIATSRSRWRHAFSPEAISVFAEGGVGQ